jgi:hypothetical protein
MNLQTKLFHKSIWAFWFLYSQILNFSLSRFAFFAFLFFIGSSLFCVYLEASSLDVDFSLVFRYSTSKPEASIAKSLVFD